MNALFQFYMPVKVCLEDGSAYQTDKWVSGDNVLIIADPFLLKSGVAKKVGDGLPNKKVVYFSDIEPNPSCENVDAAAAVAREIQADCIIGIGGGSSLDVAKIVACLVSNPGSIYDYYGGGTKTLLPRTAQLICIPTTSGTGSEVTNVGVFTNRKTGKKVPMLHQSFWADVSLIDSCLTYSLPAAVTASTGMDAFCHAIEAYWNKESQPICDSIAMKALKLIFENIKTAYDQPNNKEARQAMCLASVMAGVAFSQTRTTGIHAVSFPLTVDFHLSHGNACAITLPTFIRVSKQQCAQKMHELATYLGCSDVDVLADKVEELMCSMKMAVRLHEVGVSEDDINHIADTGLEAAIIQLTPADMNKQTLTALLRSIL